MILFVPYTVCNIILTWFTDRFKIVKIEDLVWCDTMYMSSQAGRGGGSVHHDNWVFKCNMQIYWLIFLSVMLALRNILKVLKPLK